MGQTTPEWEAAEANKRAECLARYHECKRWLDTRDRDRITRWLNTLPPEYQQQCRATLNRMREQD
ncbi:hypothetical protein [Oceanisphaera arctica]|uniref:Uncharacterized protein n=1 Tax=Oceanisphaera arctica TaxID=641510 RepID=A0A2P5TK48_9GAMM|nr:hypothetical protein [Oceanisphaera arctica]PPL15473.1 hypothetical protein UN63_12405 [Oceanisphaera arctica]GHA05404.1 hypothetical protein GCM10007082_02880 [Oceanisphaera arctica]